MKNKGAEGLENRRVALVVDEAEDYISAMSEAATSLKDRALSNRVDGFISSVRAMVQSVKQDPRDLGAARKYLNLYLFGARDATIKFVELYQKSADTQTRTDYEALLTDLEKNFDWQRQKMLLDDPADLDVEIDVLRNRLRHKGVETQL